MNAYRDRMFSRAPADIISGDLSDRLAGLAPLLSWSSGLSVHDVGCHVGVVLEAFGAAGAEPLAGCDVHEPSLTEAAPGCPAPASIVTT